jgi:hypothetical protein
VAGTWTRRRTLPQRGGGKSAFHQRFTQKISWEKSLTTVKVAIKNVGMPQEERALIDDVARRLVNKYAAFPPDHVAAVVRHAHARFRGSRVRDFIPLLVERRAVEELSTLTPDLAAVAFADLGVAGTKTIAI